MALSVSARNDAIMADVRRARELAVLDWNSKTYKRPTYRAGLTNEQLAQLEAYEFAILILKHEFRINLNHIRNKHPGMIRCSQRRNNEIRDEIDTLRVRISITLNPRDY